MALRDVKRQDLGKRSGGFGVQFGFGKESPWRSRRYFEDFKSAINLFDDLGFTYRAQRPSD